MSRRVRSIARLTCWSSACRRQAGVHRGCSRSCGLITWVIGWRSHTYETEALARWLAPQLYEETYEEFPESRYRIVRVGSTLPPLDIKGILPSRSSYQTWLGSRPSAWAVTTST